MSISVDIGPLADKILAGVVNIAGAEWAKISEADRQLVEACSLDAAKVTLLALTEPDKAAAAKKQIDAQLANIKVAASEAAGHTVWRVVAGILDIALPILVKSVLR